LIRIGFFLSSLIFLFSTNNLQAQSVAINELLASNDTTLADADGDFKDWIELYNYGTDTVDLTGFGISDTPGNPFRWVFPQTKLVPGEFLLLWASGKNRLQGPELHTNFSLSASGEPVLLTNPSGIRVDSIPAVAHATDVSYGRQPDGMGALAFFYEPTPEASNTSDPFSALLTVPIISHGSGFYSDTLIINISHPDTDATIVYTTDGSMPMLNRLSGKAFEYKNQYKQRTQDPVGPMLTDTIKSQLYINPLELTNASVNPNKVAAKSITWHRSPNYLQTSPVKKAQVLRARIFKNGVGGPIATRHYFISDLQDFETDLPIIALSGDEDVLFDYFDGIMVAGVDFENWRAGTNATATPGSPANYRRTGRDQEARMHFEYFTGQQSRVSQEVGVRVHGGFGRAFYPKSLRLYARNAYGQNAMDYPFFDRLPHTNYRRLLLRNSGQDYMNTYFRDAFIQQSVRHLDFDYQEYEPSVLYLNGEYWGLINLRERIDAHYLNRRYGLNPEEIDLLDHNALVMAGDSLQFVAMRQWIGGASLTDDSVFAQVATMIDLDNFTDYYISQIFINNTDWPGGNIRYFRKRIPYNPLAPKGHDGRWRWIMFDTDFGFGRVGQISFNTLAFATSPTQTNWANYPESTVILRSLLENEAYKSRFVNRFADLLNTTFETGRIITLIDSIADHLSNDMPNHIGRWNIMQNWSGQVETMRIFARDRPFFQRGHLRSHFQLEDTLTITLDVDNPTSGFIKVNTIEIHPATVGVLANPWPWQGVYFRNHPIQLEAIAQPGFRFSHWSGGTSSTDSVITISRNQSFDIKAHFEPIAPSDELIYFWLFDQQLPNDFPLEQIVATYSVTSQLPTIDYISCLAGYPYQPGHPQWRKASMERRNKPTEMNYRPEANRLIAFENTTMRGLQVRAPFASSQGENIIHMALSTTGYKDIQLSVAADTEDGPYAMALEYWDTLSNAWIATGMPLHSQFLDSTYQILSWDFSRVSAATNNPDFRVKLRFLSSQPTVDDGSRVTLNNLAVTGNPFQTTHLAESQNQKTRVTIAPNPTRKQAVISTDSDKIGMQNLVVTNAMGQIFFQESHNSSKKQIVLDVSSWPAGTYFLMVEVAGTTQVHKMIVAEPIGQVR
jgi:hypothetical protein